MYNNVETVLKSLGHTNRNISYLQQDIDIMKQNAEGIKPETTDSHRRRMPPTASWSHRLPTAYSVIILNLNSIISYHQPSAWPSNSRPSKTKGHIFAGAAHNQLGHESSSKTPILPVSEILNMFYIFKTSLYSLWKDKYNFLDSILYNKLLSGTEHMTALFLCML